MGEVEAQRSPGARSPDTAIRLEPKSIYQSREGRRLLSSARVVKEESGELALPKEALRHAQRELAEDKSRN